MSKEPKTAKTIEELIDKLKMRSMTFGDERAAQMFLLKVHYYRFSGYTFHFRDEKDDLCGLAFERVREIYELDQDIRAVLMKYLAKIEGAFKARLCHEIALEQGSVGYYSFDDEEFYSEEFHTDFLNSLSIAMHRNSKLPFVAHHITEYDSIMPIWAACEILSFSEMSMFYSNLKPKNRRLIEKYYMAINHKVLRSWFKLLAEARNWCAHHNRIYKATCKTDAASWGKRYTFKRYSVYSFFRIIGILLMDSIDRAEYLTDIKQLIDKYPSIDFSDAYDFEEDWEHQLLGAFDIVKEEA